MTQQGAQDQGTMDAAREQVQEQAHNAAEQARGLASQAGDQARGMVDQGSTQAGEQIGRRVDDVRAVAEQLREQGKDGPARLAEQAADRAERVGGHLRDSDADRILSDVERMARENPWVVVAGGIALGFALVVPEGVRPPALRGVDRGPGAAAAQHARGDGRPGSRRRLELRLRRWRRNARDDRRG